jgi:hypothetical protein
MNRRLIDRRLARAARALKCRRSQRGSTLIEFALLLPIFVAMFTGILDIGWMFWQNSAIQVAVQDGCRAGSITDSGQNRVYMSTVQSTARAAMVSRLQALGVPCHDCTATATPITVGGLLTLECSMDRTAESIAGLFAGMTLESTTISQMEFQR